MADNSHQVVLESLRTKHPEYRRVPDAQLMHALLSKHPEYADHVGPTGVKLALSHSPNPPRYVIGAPRGLLVPGNLNLNGRPFVVNADGSVSTEYSTSFGDAKGREILVPTVVNGRFLTPNGAKPEEGSPEEKAMFQAAQKHYVDTGEHLGIFDSPENADAYAHTVHMRPMQQ